MPPLTEGCVAMATIILMVAAAFCVATMLLRLYMQSVFKRSISAFSKKGVTGASAAKAFFRYYKLSDIEVNEIAGVYNDRYLPKVRAMLVSSGAFSSTQIAAVTSLLFEAARAVLYEKKLGVFLVLRRFLFQLLYLLSYPCLAAVAVLCVLGRFELLAYPIAVFPLGFIIAALTLPLDLYAARIAKKGMVQCQVFTAEELPVTFEVLSACAYTFMASSYKAVINLFDLLKNLMSGLFLRRTANKAV